MKIRYSRRIPVAIRLWASAYRRASTTSLLSYREAHLPTAIEQSSSRVARRQPRSFKSLNSAGFGAIRPYFILRLVLRIGYRLGPVGSLASFRDHAAAVQPRAFQSEHGIHHGVEEIGWPRCSDLKHPPPPRGQGVRGGVNERGPLGHLSHILSRKDRRTLTPESPRRTRRHRGPQRDVAVPYCPGALRIGNASCPRMEVAAELESHANHGGGLP